MSTKQQRLETALDAIHAREAAKRPKPVEAEKPKRRNVTANVTAGAAKQTASVESYPVVIHNLLDPHLAVGVDDDAVAEPVEIVNELDAIGEGDQ